ncbi:MAG TPA: sulfatase-like hydrolase/transferase [Candidatus Hydrogenedentes bacterium]|nr:sulfatase-like hydrolase/transferase [Candidatus Hydrogenedentota bacterium]
MAIVFYVAALVLSSGLAGLMASQILGEYGYIHGLNMSATAAGGAACAFASLQLFYMAGLRLLFPTRSRAPLFGEALSQLAALSFVPYLLHLPVPWPHPALQKFALFIFLGGFVAAHGFLKLASFYAAIRGKPAGRLPMLAWLLCGGICMGGSVFLSSAWLRAAESRQAMAPSQTARHVINGQYATARLTPERAAIPVEWGGRSGGALALLLARPEEGAPDFAPDAVDDAERIARAYVTFEFGKKNRVTVSATLAQDAWTEVRLPVDQIPKNQTKALVFWESHKAPAWQRHLGIRHSAAMDRCLLVAGPHVQEERAPGGGPNFVLVVVDALGADHVSALGYKRGTTPLLDRLAHNALLFSNAYTPAPESAAACATVLTGVNPLRHGFLGRRAGPLPDGLRTIAEIFLENGYATAAFTDGEMPSGLERGFLLLDSSQPSPDADSATILDKAQSWILAHAGVKYFVFVHLRELGNFQWRERYAPGFTKGVENPTTLDAYDSALAYVDHCLGSFLQAIRSSDAGKSTVTAVTSSHGYDFFTEPQMASAAGLSERSLHVPLWLHGTDIKKTERPDPIGLEDLAPTLLALAGTASSIEMDGENLLPGPLKKTPVSMSGSPLALSIRFDRWRLTWQSGRMAFGSGETTDSGAVLGLYDALQARRLGVCADVSARNPDLTARLRTRLEDYLKKKGSQP